MTDFERKRVLITGASSGIGKKLAVELASRGASVALAARGADALEATAQQCRQSGARALAVPTDVGDSMACAQLVQRAVDELGGLDIVVNNAALLMAARFDEVEDLAIFDKLIRVNYLGAVYCSYHALPHLKQSDGLLVAISSLNGRMAMPTRTGYAASKHAMQGFFDSLRVELRNTGVDVLVVSPGYVETGIRDRALGSGAGRNVAGATRMTTDECVAQILDAMAARRRELIMTPEGKLGVWMRVVSPWLLDQLAARAMKDGGR